MKILTCGCGSIHSIFAFYKEKGNFCTPMDGFNSSRIFNLLDSLGIWSKISVQPDAGGDKFLVNIVPSSLENSKEFEIIDAGITIDQLYYDADDMESTSQIINKVMSVCQSNDIDMDAEDIGKIFKSMSGMLLSYYSGDNAASLNWKWYGKVIPECLQGKQVEHIYNHHRTEFMSSEDSTFYVELPTAKQIIATLKYNNFDFDSQTVTATDIFTGNTNEYSFIDIADMSAIANGKSGISSVADMISLDVLPIEKNVTKFYRYYYIEDAPLESFENGYGPEAILGAVSNNSLDIQENEREFWEDAKNLYIDCISLENMVFSDDLFVSEYAGKTSFMADEYFKTLAEEAYNLSQAHTGQTISPVQEMLEDEEDTASTGKFDVQFGSLEKIPDGTYIIRDSMSIEAFEAAIDEIPGKYNGFNLMSGYMNNFCKHNYKWIECLIKLCRWGNRKPTHLCITGAQNDKGEPMYFELRTSQLSGFNGDRNSLTKKFNEDGSHIRIVSLITVPLPTQPEFAMIIKKHYSNLPNNLSDALVLGAYLSEMYTDSSGKDFEFNKFEDIFMLAERIKQGCKYCGVSYDESTDTISYSNEIEYTQLSPAFLSDEANEMSISNKDFREDMSTFSDKLSEKNCNIFKLFSIFAEDDAELTAETLIQNGADVSVGKNNSSVFPDWQCFLIYTWLPKLLYISRFNSLADILNVIPNMPKRWHTSLNPDFLNLWAGEKRTIQFSPIEFEGNTIGYICIANKVVAGKKVRIYLLIAPDDLSDLNAAIQAKAIENSAFYTLSTDGTAIDANSVVSSKSVNTWKTMLLKMIDKYRVEGITSAAIKMATADTENAIYKSLT